MQGITLATTIGPVDAGLISVLEDRFREKTGTIVRHFAAGTGKALEMARKGLVDLVLVHARALEEEFISQGHGTRRYPLMYNCFLIVGPRDDPAGARKAGDPAGAFRAIAQAGALFVSRGDKSGTNVKETELWKKAGIEPGGSWYEVYERGNEGNVATLAYSDGRLAYTLIDRATYISLRARLRTVILVEGHEDLLNRFSLIPVNPLRHPSARYGEAMEFVKWLTSSEGQAVIGGFGTDRYGEPLFFPDADNAGDDGGNGVDGRVSNDV